uniref:Uncharacterized protein n=1 Tax=Tolypiocladia glomerulata TaxID=860646 RepID=A0A1Z1MUG3_9FLOR|nr:hypothetical protein [Tolypiocladia glomerulata]ARW69728.1 hypothetical protein [Tolypiocladia glomerulata]
MLNYETIKSLSPFILLTILPYNYKITILIISILSLIKNNRKLYFLVLLKNLYQNTLFCLYTILLSNLNNEKYLNKVKMTEKVMYFPFFISLLSNKEYYWKLTIHCLIITTPEYVIMIAAIQCINLLITYTIIYISNNEKVFCIFLSFLYTPVKSKRHVIRNINSLSLYISYQIIEKLKLKILQIYVGISSKNNFLDIKTVIYNKKNIPYFINKILIDKEILVINIWNRYYQNNKNQKFYTS